MKLEFICKTLVTVVLAATLSACGGGGGDGTITLTAPPVAGIDRTGIAVGTIDGFGSIIVNGQRWETDNAVITVDDVAATQADLAVGDVVRIVGTIDTNGNATAQAVAADDAVEGPIESIDLAAGSLVVLGQTVFVDGDTSFDDDISPAGLDGLAVGDIIEVAGFMSADGTIRATRIEPKSPGDDFELTGVVANHDAVAMTFEIGTQAVDYSMAALQDLPNGAVADDLRVEVEGDTFGPNGELIATVVEFEDGDLDGDDGDDVEIEGLVTAFTDASNFEVNGIPVTTNAATEFERGTAADLALNVKVEIEGDFDTNGVVVADKVEFEENQSIRIEAAADSVDGAGGTLVVLGITVATNLSTRFEDKTDLDLEPFGIGDVAAGDYVKIRGRLNPADPTQVVASRLERDDARSKVKLQAPIESLAEPAFTLLGVTVETTTTTDFEGGSGGSPTQAEFFMQVVPGSLVNVSGAETSNTVIVADEVEIEDD